ncbi:hypothetical protein ACFY2M_43095 [Streptomyces sp. NPDC001276]|uniref:hypothetical protein n=1 Tax=Streptomyces sp. NPDC001276 TaxID=3364555 RepID=UPI0036CC4070
MAPQEARSATCGFAHPRQYLRVRVERLPGRTDDAAKVLLELEGTEDPAQLASELFQDDGVIDVEMTTGDEE